ncbi:spindle and centriole-associated protein 1-like [Watersipora subatra]|uniref:spindle and centriole-associated protein 1-like n=1 Tax=Watersipora subatra TaxID=2589382 RepID=UPI00355B0C1A
MSLVVSKSKRKAVSQQKRHPKPDWDFTVNDLTELRATPEEVARRQEAHRSKNLELVRKAAIEKRIASARRQGLSDFTNRSGSGNAFLREILYNNGEFNQLADDTSKALQVAHDIFGDEARRYKAIPAITSINSDDEENAIYHSRSAVTDGLIKSSTKEQTKLEKLSNSVMKRTALNETYSASSSSSSASSSRHQSRECSERKTCETTPIVDHPPRIDLQRFQRLIDQENLSTIASESSAAPTATRERELCSQKSPNNPKHTVETTQAGEKQRKKTPKKRKSLPSAESTDLSSLLSQLEASLQTYERDYSVTGHNSTASSVSSSLCTSTFTVSLMSVLHRLLGYFGQLQEKLREEKRDRVIKDQQMLDLTNRTDLLTKELIETQQQFHVVLDELTRVKTDQRQEIDTIKATLARVSKGGTVHSVHVTQPQSTTVCGGQSKVTPALSLRPSASPTKVTTYKEFEGSHEQMKLLDSSRLPYCSPTKVSAPTTAVVENLPLSPEPTGTPGVISESDDGLTLEQKISQLRGDHQETLERFRKLGEEMQKEHPKTAAFWLTDNL